MFRRVAVASSTSMAGLPAFGPPAGCAAASLHPSGKREAPITTSEIHRRAPSCRGIGGLHLELAVTTGIGNRFMGGAPALWPRSDSPLWLGATSSDHVDAPPNGRPHAAW